MTYINSVFLSSFKLERIYRLSQHMLEHGICLNILDIKHRNPLLILKSLLYQPRNTILLTHEWLMVPVLLAIVNLLKGNSYVLILNGVLWDAWVDYGWSRIRIVFYSLVFKFVAKRCDAIVCNSDYLCNRLLQRFPTLSVKATVIYNAIDEPVMPTSIPQIYHDGCNNFVTLTNFEYPKKFIGINLILEAMRSFDINQFKLYILGKVITDMGKLAAEDFVQNVKTVYADVDCQVYLNANIAYYLQPESSIFIYSAGEGGDSLPRAILEAQAIGMPSIIVDTNGCGEAVSIGESAILVSPVVEEILLAMKAIVAPEFDRTLMSEKAIQNIKTRFSWISMAHNYCQLLTTIHER